MTRRLWQQNVTNIHWQGLARRHKTDTATLYVPLGKNEQVAHEEDVWSHNPWSNITGLFRQQAGKIMSRCGT